MLAEYLVARALECCSEYHEQWDDFDVRYGRFKVEVKSSGYLTPPFPTVHSNPNPRFDIAKRTEFWSESGGRRVAYDVPKRPADAYVFCYHKAQTAVDYHPFDLGQWSFLAASTALIDTTFEGQKSASWSSLQSVAVECEFPGLRNALDRVLQGVQI